MLARRIIPCLDVRDGVVVKGVKFRNHRIVGGIAETARRYRDEGADELVLYDITASVETREVGLDHYSMPIDTRQLRPSPKSSTSCHPVPRAMSPKLLPLACNQLSARYSTTQPVAVQVDLPHRVIALPTSPSRHFVPPGLQHRLCGRTSRRRPQTK